jgi:glycosyltransferase involved in cell wall biosynthesis
VRISQNGNTANNGFHNLLILSGDSSVEMIGRPSCAGIRHAFSQPAWDVFPHVEISDPSSPIWSNEESIINRAYTSELIYPYSLRKPRPTESNPSQYQIDLDNSMGIRSYDLPESFAQVDLRKSTIEPKIRNVWVGKVIAVVHKTLFVIKRLKNVYSEQRTDAASVDVHVTFGSATPRISSRLQKQIVSVVVEHGQVRWIFDGSNSLKQQRRDFHHLCTNSDHIWITNVDERTLDIAEELFPGKWSVLPHPYVLDERAPFSEVPPHRDHLCSLVDSDFLIFSPSSISIGGDQQKGTDKLLNAIALLRHRDGIRVGLFMVSWGQDVQKACALIDRLGIQDQCRFINPLPRVGLQKFMANFDLVSDQFDYDAFGSLTIRALEQGMPLLSKPIGDRAGKLMGRKPPVLPASSVEEIREQVLKAITEQQTLGRNLYLSLHREQSRSWVTERHHHSFTERLQVERYQELIRGDINSARPGRWGELPNWTPTT